MTESEMKFYGRLAVAAALLLAVLLAGVFKRPMRVSMTENVFIEVGEGQEGPPEFYRLAVTLPDGREIYISNGSCKVQGGEQ